MALKALDRYAQRASAFWRDTDGLMAPYVAVMLIAMGDYGVLWVTRYEQARRSGMDVRAALVHTAKAEWVSERQVYWLARLAAESANIRAAVDFCLNELGDAESPIVVQAPRLYHKKDHYNDTEKGLKLDLDEL